MQVESMTSTPTLSGPSKDPDLDMLLRQLLREAIRRTGLSYQIVAGELTKRTAKGISTAMIGNWVSDQKEAWHIPAYIVPAICEFLGSDAIQRALLNPDQRDALELGQSLRRISALFEKKATQAKELARLARTRKGKR